MDVFIASTTTAGLTPLGPANQRSLVLLEDVLRTRLGPAHASLFADPVPSEFGDQFDWYAPHGGTPIPYPDLSEPDKSTLLEQLHARCADIAALGESLKASSDLQERMLGEALTNAVEIPSESSIYALRDAASGEVSPIVINWGWVCSEDRNVRGVLTGRTTAPRIAPVAAMAAPAMAAAGTGHADVATAMPWAIWPWLIGLGWVILTLLVALILWLLIYPCGLTPGRFVYFCPTPVVATSDPLAAERLVLEDQIAALEADLAAQDRMCQPIAAPPPPSLDPPAGLDTPPPADLPVIPAPPQDELDARLEERGGTLGELNFALYWNSIDDIDLHVTCPSGERVYFNARSACGGTLDIDANAAGRRVSDPVENIFFANLLPGQYEVSVYLFSDRTPGPKPFTLRVRQSDGTVQDLSGVVSSSAPDWRQTITVGN
ncbi:MAG: hypothetical protein WAO78_11535 [Roseovarius sp.]